MDDATDPDNSFIPVDPDNINIPPSPESLEEKLQAYHHHIHSEFNVAPEDDPELGEKVRRALLSGSIEAAKTIVHLARYADKDSTRLSASKVIVDVALNRTLGQDDPLKQLFNELNKAPSNPSNEQN